MALSQTFFSLFDHVLFTVLGSDWMCSSLCQLSGDFTAEDGDPALGCGCLWGAAYHWALFEMNLYKWGNSGLPGHASGDHWQLACHQDTALVASDLYNQTKSFLNKESQWFLELFILATVTLYDIQICVNVTLVLSVLITLVVCTH